MRLWRYAVIHPAIRIIDPAVNTFAMFAILQVQFTALSKVDAQFQFFFQFKIKELSYTKAEPFYSKTCKIYKIPRLSTVTYVLKSGDTWIFLRFVPLV